MSFDRKEYINQPLSNEIELKVIFNPAKPLCIFDIGACEGEETIKYARLFPQSKIFSFEPLPANIELIKENFLKYNIKNATYVNKALSFKNGYTEFHVSSGRPKNAVESDWDYGNKSSSLLPPGKHLESIGFIHFDEKIEVETITLKTFCASKDIGSIDFMHMDVQGAELMVLEGAADFLASIKVIWLEVSKVDFYQNQPLVDDVEEFMARNNFTLVKDSLYGSQGDQLYISKYHYSKFSVFTITNLILAKDIKNRVLRKLHLVR